ncbi:MAG: HAD family hydrolase [Opitutales bacterium]|nr:HAD family hydrolase [Opitutales bacterium]
MSFPSFDKKLGVVFDLDGTLANSLPMVIGAFQYAVNVYRTPPTEEEVLSRIVGPAEINLRNLLQAEHYIPAAMNRLLEYNAQHRHEIVPFPGSTELLRDLLKAGTPVALWTGRDRDTTDEILTRFKWWPYFQKVVCGDDFETHKPDPEGLESILAELTLNSSEILFLGDADVDALAAYAVGADTLLIEHGRKVSARIRSLCREIVDTPESAYRVVRAKVLTQGTALGRQNFGT